MDELEKLNCKEEICELSDLEHSATDDLRVTEGKIKKKRRRRREIDLISEDDETEDEGLPKKMYRRLSPGPGPISPASHREPRTCVLKASQKRRPLSRLLEQLLRNLEKRDPNQFFAWPVNDNFAPGYSTIIKRPMDFSTMKQKIDDNDYKSLNCFISDFKLMCNNAMKYNKVGTIYHKAAKRLLHAGLKQLTPQKLRPLGDILTYMYEIPLRELGFDIGKMDVHKVLKRSSPIKSGGSEEAASDGGEGGETGGDGVKIQMEAAREQHRRRLAKKAFPRMDADGKTTLKLVTHTVEGSGDDRPMTLGQYIGKLTQGTGSLHSDPPRRSTQHGQMRQAPPVRALRLVRALLRRDLRHSVQRRVSSRTSHVTLRDGARQRGDAPVRARLPLAAHLRHGDSLPGREEPLRTRAPQGGRRPGSLRREDRRGRAALAGVARHRRGVPQRPGTGGARLRPGARAAPHLRAAGGAGARAAGAAVGGGAVAPVAGGARGRGRARGGAAGGGLAARDAGPRAARRRGRPRRAAPGHGRHARPPRHPPGGGRLRGAGDQGRLRQRLTYRFASRTSTK